MTKRITCIASRKHHFWSNAGEKVYIEKGLDKPDLLSNSYILNSLYSFLR